MSGHRSGGGQALHQQQNYLLSCVVTCDTMQDSQKKADAGVVLLRCWASVCASVSGSLSNCFFCEHDCVRNLHWADVASLVFYNGSATASINVLLNEQFILLIIYDLYLYCTF